MSELENLKKDVALEVVVSKLDKLLGRLDIDKIPSVEDQLADV